MKIIGNLIIGLIAEMVFLYLPIDAFFFHATSTDMDFTKLDLAGVNLLKAGNLLGFYPSALLLSPFFPHSAYPGNDWLNKVAICFMPQVAFWSMISYFLVKAVVKLMVRKD